MADSGTALERLGIGLAGEAFAQATAGVREAVTLHVADTVAAWIAGAATGEGQRLIRFRQGLGVEADDAAANVMTHCAVTRLSEIDDIHPASMITPGSIVVPAVLEIAAALRVSHPGKLAVAIAAGYEAMVRLGRAVDGPAILYRGIWPTCFAASFGVAASAARLMDLDATQTAHALGMALTVATPGVAQPPGAATSRWLAAGIAARDGLAAAQAAKAGFVADLKLFEGNFLPGIYNITPDLAALVDGIGTSPAIATTSFKPWCAARQTMAATQAFKDILQVVDTDDIFDITAHVLPPHLRMVDHGIQAGDRISYLTSLPYQMAVAVLAPEAGFDVGKAAPSMSPAITALMAKITVKADEALLADYPRIWRGRVTVSAKSGRHERAVNDVPGDLARPLSAKDIAGKFQRLATPVIGADDAARMLDACFHILDESGAVRRLLDRIEALYDERSEA